MFNRAYPHMRAADRRGATLVLTAFLLVVIVAMVSFAVDLGYLANSKAELQRAADASALAAGWALADELIDSGDPYEADAHAREAAVEYAAYNDICRTAPVVDANTGNSADGDVVVGYVSDLEDPNCPLDTSDPSKFNAVRVRVRKTAEQNGRVPYFFARIFGLQGEDMECSATAALARNIKGFKAPTNGESLDILPFALDLTTWNAMLAGGTDDDWTWDEDNECVVPGSDGILEVNLYPQGTGAPGNRGTIDLGSASNSTDDICRQIMNGISADDLAYHGGQLVFNESREMYLNGDTGISASVKSDLEAIKGEKRVIPIFSSVTQSGNNAMYTICRLVGVRVLDVHLTGPMKNKRVICQPAPLRMRWVVTSTDSSTSDYVYTPVILMK